MNRFSLSFIFAALFTVQTVLATHIVGGYISYRFISGTTYEVKLTIYRDCTSATPFDGAPGATTDAILGLFNSSNGLVTSYNLVNPVITNIDPPNDNPCLQINSNICVQQGVYTTTITLPSATSAYTLAHVRCCRNGTINNVFLPGDQGAVYSAYIPPTNPFQNSSPVFNNFPPLFICVNAPLIFDHSATDIDGDVLRYSLCTPSNGGTAQDPAPNPPPAPPYNPIPWEAGYSVNNLLGGAPPLTIDSITGLLTGTPNVIGQFVVGVCVSEYRNGQIISTYMRDFQFNVTQCNIPVASIPSTNINPQTGIGTYVQNCNDLYVEFQHNAYNPPPTNIPLTYQWDFGVPGITTDTSTDANPFYTYPDTGTYIVRLIVVKGSGANACSDTGFALVKLYPPAVADFTTTDVCRGDTARFFDISTTPIGTISQWQWRFGNGQTATTQNPVTVYDTAAVYPVRLIVTSSEGCVDSITKTINIFNGPNTDFSYTPPCIFSQVTFTPPNPSTQYNYLWTFPGGFTATGQSAQYTFNTPGTFAVKLVGQNNFGCEDSTTKFITVQTPVQANVDSSYNACVGYPVQLIASGGTYYQWYPQDVLSDDNSATPIATVTQDTWFTVIVSNDCFSDTAYTVAIMRPLPTVNAGNDTTIWRDTPAFLSGTTDGVEYFWNPSNWLDEPFSLQTKATPPQTTWYELFARNAFGCINKDSILVTVVSYEIFDIPTAFSPNGDGVNDVFRILRWLNIGKLSDFSVYNRWGQQVFSTNNVEAGWDGTYRGQACDIGTYVWMANVLNKEGKQITYKGNVTLIR